MDTLESLHNDMHGIWDKIVRLIDQDDPAKFPEIKTLHQQTREMAEKINQLRRETFGNLNHDSELNINSEVESSRMDAIVLESLQRMEN